jgi:hypothetical protein
MEKNFTLRTIVLIKAISISIGIAIGVLICEKNYKPITKSVYHNDTIVVLKARIDTLKLERIKLKTIYEKDIDTIYLMDSTAIDSAYAKAIERLIELEQAGFFTN